MNSLKTLLITENINLLGFKISTFILTSIVLFTFIFIILKIKRISIKDKLLELLFFILLIMSLLISFTYALTGEALFSQNINLRIYSLITMFVFARQVRKTWNNLIK